MCSRILVVEDDPIQQLVLGNVLRNAGFAVLFASDGEQASRTFLECGADLLILDVNLPLKNGFQVCRELKSNPDTRLIPVVMATGLSEVQDRVRGIEAGADDFLSKPIEPTELVARVRSLLNLKAYTDELERAESVLIALATSIEGKDPYTEGHCERLSRYSVFLGRALGLDEDSLVALNRGGAVHDIGKVAIPDAILLKPGRLNDEEMQVVKNHTVIGERICAPLRSFKNVLPIIRHHHEKQDGTGYPDQLRGNQVELLARVLQVTDVYDALRTERPYKKALSMAEALATMEMEVDRGWWDPTIFREFQRLARSGALENGSFRRMLPSSRGGSGGASLSAS